MLFLSSALLAVSAIALEACSPVYLTVTETVTVSTLETYAAPEDYTKYYPAPQATATYGSENLPVPTYNPAPAPTDVAYTCSFSIGTSLGFEGTISAKALYNYLANDIKVDAENVLSGTLLIPDGEFTFVLKYETFLPTIQDRWQMLDIFLSDVRSEKLAGMSAACGSSRGTIFIETSLSVTESVKSQPVKPTSPPPVPTYGAEPVPTPAPTPAPTYGAAYPCSLAVNRVQSIPDLEGVITAKDLYKKLVKKLQVDAEGVQRGTLLVPTEGFTIGLKYSAFLPTFEQRNILLNTLLSSTKDNNEFPFSIVAECGSSLGQVYIKTELTIAGSERKLKLS